MQLQTAGSELIPATFEFGQIEIRVFVDIYGELWFLAKDVFDALEITWNGAAGSLKNYPEKWQRVLQCQTPSGVQNAIFLAEPGLYQTIFNSRKPAARRFVEFVFETILPNYRLSKAARELTPMQHVQLTRQLQSLVAQMSQGNELFIRTMYPAAVQLAGRAGMTLPPVKQFVENPDQPRLPGV